MAFGGAPAAPADQGEFDPIEETPRGRALIAIKELEFDRETGKIAEDDYRDLKERLALEAMKVLDQPAEPAGAARGEPLTAAGPKPACEYCGPRPEPDALYCSSCGRRVPAAALS
jgi:hypothetical protein